MTLTPLLSRRRSAWVHLRDHQLERTEETYVNAADQVTNGGHHIVTPAIQLDARLPSPNVETRTNPA